nr:L-lactate dehydrogenase [Eubacteriales bacterium]
MGKKISILGVGNVGASTAFSLTLSGIASQIVLVDINKAKAQGEALDLIQGTPFSAPVDVYSGEYEDTKGSDVVIVALGIARKPGQSRLDLAQTNVNIVKSVMPEVVKYAPDAVYVVISNPVDILTYTIIKTTGLPASRVIGSGTMLDTARLRTRIAEYVDLNPKNIHAYVYGEHGDSSMIPWSLTSIAGMQMKTYCKNVLGKEDMFSKTDLDEIEHDMRTGGAKVIGLKGATYYAIAASVHQIVECIFQNIDTVLTVSSMINDRYGINDVCLSLPFVVGVNGISREINPPLLPIEEEQLRNSANVLKGLIANLDI